jgi:hypothetical protein
MLKKTIKYEDFDGNEVEETYYFHLSKAELVELEMSHEGGLHDYLQRIVDSNDGKAVIAEFKNLILAAYGERSDDGKRFIKSQEMRDEFASTEAYSTLFMELCVDADKAAEFINGMVPAGLEKDVAKLTATQRTHPSDFAAQPVRGPDPDPQILTQAEVAEMDSDELKSGLATGRYKLS